MGDHDYPATCLSSFEHGNDVRDVVLHYFGCLREAEGEAYFKHLPRHKQDRITKEQNRILEQRALFEVNDRTKDLVRKFRKSLSQLPYVRGRTEDTRRHSGDNLVKLCKENAWGMSAYVIFFRNSERYTDPNCSDHFPNQKLDVKDLLYNKDEKTNPLMRPCEKDEIRYFHLPGNNMEWIEEAIARYYNEERPPYDGLFRRPENPSKTYMLLRPEFWRGQQHGGRHDAVHARHMRPRCDVISTDPESLEDSPKNLVLFMPYLHWETDRRRVRFDEIMRNISQSHLRKEKGEAKNRHPIPTPKQISDGSNASGEPSQRGAVNGSAAGSNLRAERPCHNKDFRMISTPTELVTAEFAHEMEVHPKSKFSKSEIAKHFTPGPLRPATVLGKVLHRAAQLYESMDYYQEQELLKEYLHHEPPFHPRRTLDQSYYWTLKTTKKRDRDQVVYRGTAPKKELKHYGTHAKAGCEQCLADIRKVPRIIMVDQLWLWILNGNTIITSFPKRYGRNKPDPSAVHKSIRLRLKTYRKNEIRSVYDLALIIVDQCSRVFFDRRKTADRQPQVMDIFASAIGNVTYKQTVAYEHFWDTTGKVSDLYKSNNSDDDVEDKAKSLLDINPEGELLREIKDILDELHIMLNIKSKQERVFKQFRKHIMYIIAPGLALSQEIGTAKHKKVLGDTDDEDSNVYSGSKENRKKKRKLEGDDKAEKGARMTLEFALDLSTGLDERIADLKNLQESAEHTEKALDGLLGLKQQQASVVQARKAVQQTEETLRQGRSIMLFTVITIIFLPLSFGSSIFGMNALEINGGLWPIHREIVYMIPISIAVIFTSFVLAFSTIIRALLSFAFDLAWTKFVTSTRLYSLWLQFRFDGLALNKIRRDWTSKWKEEARKAKQARKEKKEEEAKRAEEDERKNGGRRQTGITFQRNPV